MRITENEEEEIMEGLAAGGEQSIKGQIALDLQWLWK
jgi:hypothetical protein